MYSLLAAANRVLKWKWWTEKWVVHEDSGVETAALKFLTGTAWTGLVSRNFTLGDLTVALKIVPETTFAQECAFFPQAAKLTVF